MEAQRKELSIEERRVILYEAGKAAGFPYVSWYEPEDETQAAWNAGKTAWANRCLRADSEELKRAYRALKER